MSPFKVLYGRVATEIPHYEEGQSSIQAVNITLQIREGVLDRIKTNLKVAQERMKHQADKKRSELKFQIGEWVLVQLKPYRQISIAQTTQQIL